MGNELAWVEYAVIVAYLAALIGIGIAFRSFNKDSSDYFRNGCRGTWWLVGASAFMQMFSAWTFTGAAGAAFEAGWSAGIVFGANVLCFFLVFLFLGPWFRQLRAVTAPEVIRMRFGPITQQVYAWLQAVLGLLYAAVWLLGLATFTASVFDLNTIAGAVGMREVEFVIVLTGLIVLTYSVTGGSWAVMATDFVQSLVLIPLTVLVAFLCLREVGGIGGMMSAIHDQGLTERFQVINAPDDFPLGKYGMWFAIATLLYKTVAYSTLITAQKYFGVKDGREARMAGLLACLLMLGGMMVWFIPPMVARLTMADEVLAADLSKPAEASYAMIAVKLLPVGLTGLMVVAMLSATMSSMDSGLNRNAAVFVRDIEPVFHRMLGYKPLDERAQLVLGRIVSMALGVMIIGLALFFSQRNGDKGVFEYMLNIGAVVALPMATPLMLALFIRRAPWWSALVSVAAAVVPATMGFLAGSDRFAGTMLESVLANPWSYQQKIFWNTGVGVAAFLVTIPFWSTATSAYRDRVDEFFRRMHTPVDFEREVGAANDRGQLIIIGWFSAGIGAVVMSLAVLPGNDWYGRLSILAVGGIVALVGAVMLIAGYRSKPGTPAVPADQTVEPKSPPASDSPASLPRPMQTTGDPA